MSYRAWRSCECVYIRLVLRVRLREVIKCVRRNTKQSKTAQKNELKVQTGKCVCRAQWTLLAETTAAWLLITTALRRWVVGTLTQQAVPFWCVQSLDLAASRPLPLDPVRGEERRRTCVTGICFCSGCAADGNWLLTGKNLRAASFSMTAACLFSDSALAWDPSHGGVISILASCSRRRSLTHDIRSHGSPTSFALHRLQSFTVNNVSDAVRLIYSVLMNALDWKKIPNKTMKTQFMSQLQPNSVVTPDYICLMSLINISD